MKLKKKYDIGGFIDSVDSSLDKLGTWGKLGVQILDPTGITGWKDLGDSIKAFQQEKDAGKSILKAGEVGLAALGAVPMIGSIGKLGKVGRSEKLISKNAKLFDYDTYKALVDSSQPAAYWMARNFSPQMKEEASKILDKEIVKIVDWCKANNIKKIPKKLENKIANFAEKQSTILGKDVDISRLLNNINWELKGFK